MEQVHCFQVNAWVSRCAVWAIVLLGVVSANTAQALPLFARQTGMACLACHTIYPELTHFGRMFKLKATNSITAKTLQVTSDEGKQLLALPAIPNLALFVMVGECSWRKPLPDSNVRRSAFACEWRHRAPATALAAVRRQDRAAFRRVCPGDLRLSADTFNIDNTDFRFANTIVLPNKTAVRLWRVDQQQPDDRGSVEYDAGVRLPVCSAGSQCAVGGGPDHQRGHRL